MIHELKIEPKYLSEISNGDKNFEIRKNDRNFQRGDFLALNEWEDGGYTGESIIVKILYVFSDSRYCKDGYVVMSIKPCNIEGQAKKEVKHGERMGNKF